MLVVLGLDNSQRKIGLMVENVVREFGLAALDRFAAYDDAAFGEVQLFANLRVDIPAGSLERGGDVLRTYVALVE